MDEAGSYIIRGGIQGRERVRGLAGVLAPRTRAMLEQLPVRPGDRCWDVGSGGGDVTLMIADMVGRTGRVLGTDLDPAKVALAEAEAAAYPQVEYRVADITAELPAETFDIAHARFLLSHLTDPAAAVAAIARTLRPGGTLAVADVDFSAPLCCPDSPAFRAYHDLYIRTGRHRGADPLIGPRLPALLHNAGLTDIHIQVNQPAEPDPATKLVHVLTLENIADAALPADLTSTAELDAILTDLRAAVDDSSIVLAAPRMVQTWGRTPR
ncbi:methyltransferase domain-containing protein [Nocardia suismassiliense]|uniref:methyltransferase domain-containing protein n=1 Tax=Nocardia suismassiliense TaxID=2077092 RepID=UPI000D1FC35E|nr:methyltransferase domain-containing protein [Nocardia suismassiliense]